VPAIARWPGVITPGRTSDHVWAFEDFLPTAAELAGAKPSTNLDGISFVPTLLGAEKAGREQAKHDFLYWEFHERGSKQAVRYGNYKAVRLSPSSPLELYDLTTDLGETRDVAAQHPEIVSKIEQYLETSRTPSEHWPLRDRRKKN